MGLAKVNAEKLKKELIKLFDMSEDLVRKPLLDRYHLACSTDLGVCILPVD